MRRGAESIPELEPLFAALHEHQVGVAPALAGMARRPAAEAWARRRASYEEWLARPGAFVLVAHAQANAIGYAVVSPGEGYDGWSSPERVADVHDVAVLAGWRGRGVGTTLMDAVERELVAAGIERYRLRVIAPNESALRFYERRGLMIASHVLVGRARNPDQPS